MTKFSKHLSIALGSLLAGAFVLVSADVHAQDEEYDHERRQRGRLMLALDGDYSSAIQNDQIEKGGGGAFRIGTQRNLFLVTLIPELTFDHHSYGAERHEDRDTASITTGKIGGRIRFLKIVEPGVFAHIGVGHVGGEPLISHTGVAFDMGGTLDLTLLPLIDIGIHGAWNRIFGGYDHGVSYGTAGVHVALVL